MQQDPSQHHNSQYEPMEIELRFHLSELSLNPKSTFYSLVTADEGLSILPFTVFSVTSRIGDAFRIQVSSVKRDFGEKRKHLSFYIVSSLREASIACSKLNMALALSCKLVVTLDDNDAVFHLTAPCKAVENVLLRHFKIFEGNGV